MAPQVAPFQGFRVLHSTATQAFGLGCRVSPLSGLMPCENARQANSSQPRSEMATLAGFSLSRPPRELGWKVAQGSFVIAPQRPGFSQKPGFSLTVMHDLRRRG
jgi:hypothetical protein